MALVKNINGSSDNNPPDGFDSWKEYWESRKGRRFSRCSNLSCSSAAEVGAHVKKAFGTNEWYIVPLCNSCNNPSNTDAFEVNASDLLRIR